MIFHLPARADRLLMPLAWCVALGLFTAAFAPVVAQRITFARANAPRRLTVTAAQVLGHAPTGYTLAEWADYECPPCRSMHETLAPALARHRQNLRFEFHNLPLVNIHTHAWAAAVAAEASRMQGKFDPVHNALFTSKAALTPDTVEKLVAAQSVDMPRFHRDCAGEAARVVRQDSQKADALKLEGTPSLLLCAPDGSVYQLHAVEQLDALLP